MFNSDEHVTLAFLDPASDRLCSRSQPKDILTTSPLTMSKRVKISLEPASVRVPVDITENGVEIFKE